MRESIDKSRRGFVFGGLAALLSPGCISKYLDARHERWMEAHAARYGTVENPAYSIREIKPNKKLQGFDALAYPEPEADEVSTRADDFRKRAKELERIYGKLSELSENSEFANSITLKATCSKYDLKALELRLEVHKTLLEYLDVRCLLLSKVVDYIEKGKNGHIRRKESEEELTRKVFMEMTGKDIPDDVTRKRRIRGDTIGYHDAYRGVIAYEDLQYLENLVTLLHEEGHLCTQHGQLGLSRQEKRKKGINDAAILEEACAFAFVNAAAHHIATYDMELAVLLKGYFDVNMRFGLEALYENPEKEQKKHPRGAELFVAARDVLQNPAKVFNYLATLPGSDLGNLDPRIKRQMQMNREKYRISKGIKQEYESIKDRIDKLAKKYKILTDSIKVP